MGEKALDWALPAGGSRHLTEPAGLFWGREALAAYVSPSSLSAGPALLDACRQALGAIHHPSSSPGGVETLPSQERLQGVISRSLRARPFTIPSAELLDMEKHGMQ